MDAREKWNETAKKIATEYAMRFGGYVKYPSGKGFDLCEEKLNELDAHLRTTPEGFALVPDKPVGEIESFAQGSYGRKYAVSITANLDAGTKLYAAPPKSESL